MNRRRVDLVARQPVAQVLEHHLDAVAGVAKNQSRNSRAHEILGEPHRRLDVALPHPELRVDDGRVVHDDLPGPGGRAALIDELDRLAADARRVLARIANGRRREQERGRRPVETCNAQQATHDVGKV